ncbi:glycosyltransferase [Hyphomonas johnsonii]|uniref:Group 1 glycosyl transferase n=1 Tax=Hyphomonas johnsonii MHS-2 TaxID=1280950 RepID=A0A059FV55_9PROT|nr:glycosyltransferase [Hyphomonas johnsonii]KCZ94555.1 group 1 glycosyl transferase [Hyphomonas johnsonii MHS-2]
MKIAFFVNAFPMMSEAFIANSAAALMDAGHSVDIFGLGNVQPTGCSVEAAAIDEMDAHTFNARWPRSRAGRLAELPSALSKISKNGGLSSLRRLRPAIYRRTFADLSAVYQASAIEGPGAYDILHCQFATLAEDVIKHRKAGFLSGNIVVNFRGYDITETVDAVGPQVYDHVWDEAASFIANCDYFKDRAVAIGCPSDRIEVIGSGIRLENFPFEPASPPAGNALRFLMVGRLIERKGFHVALRALASFSAQSSARIHVDIVGDGAMRAELEALAHALGLGQSVRFHGARTHSEIADFIRRTDVFLAPSMTSATGGQDAPVNTLKEAMAIGRPVIATYHGGIPELVIEGETGAMADEADVSSLCAAIERLTAAPSAWPAIVKRARRKVEDMYGLDKCTDKLVSHYEKCLARANDNAEPVNNNALRMIAT